ncbi:MAG: LytTR family DNA-binding domain-containing protein [Bacteroidia bacterium]|jgi:DNA-binding LytR/AlgR family response regulator|nr:LytTR family DNA-binding domain-containing protein [Bacteroidia bacterium]GIV22482.1 MAG: DNA-binding response regulator [Bacteroidia bacterium]
MSLWRVLVVEDEEPARRLLRRYLSQIPDLDLTEASDGETALQALQEQEWDIVLLDIEMPGVDGVSLMHFASSLPRPPAIVFTTAYSEHAVKAFEGGAADYLLKPFSLDRLRQAIARAQRKRQAALSAAATPKTSLSKLPIPQKEGHLLIAFEDIVGIRIEDRTLYIETRSGEIHTTRAYTLQQVEEKLPHPPFLRIGRDALINTDAVQEVLSWFAGRYKVVLHNGSVYMCSRDFAPTLLRTLGLKE